MVQWGGTKHAVSGKQCLILQNLEEEMSEQTSAWSFRNDEGRTKWRAMLSMRKIEGGRLYCSSEVGSAGSLTWIPVPSASEKLAGKLMHIYSDRNNNNNENW